ncbi:polyamine aminopropyltransferase [Spirulina sp. CS-785/01]|uniref:polyamine aminopropyltransferase n=1 Tax=Spirulina sp. CS-785/01 TaxID=3021716 RepID=UPI00232B31E0|nr:polyamine aminopropyltransferase [Spirulina sp. CS-785/01]MDB9315211.1 polyamine aminopropyltransferase [Spirulina sp. CS-785/01]
MAGSEVKADAWIKEYITPWDVYEHGIKRLLAYKRTQFQEMYIVETGAYGKALVLDGKWQSCTGDEFLYHEPLVHPAMIAHQAPKTALILGGGEGATVREILRWTTIERVVMVDIDGEVVDACKEHLPEMHQGAFEDSRLELVIGDALQYLADTKEKWDIIISDLSDPIEEGPSFQLFTQEYFQQIKGVLASGGFFVVQAGPTAIAEIQLHARLVKTLRTVFPHVTSYASPVPTYAVPWGFALASDTSINTRPEPEEIDALLAEKTTGGFKLIDGISLLGLLQTPAYVRKAIAEADMIYTLKEPPKFFGKGVKGNE